MPSHAYVLLAAASSLLAALREDDTEEFQTLLQVIHDGLNAQSKSDPVDGELTADVAETLDSLESDGPEAGISRQSQLRVICVRVIRRSLDDINASKTEQSQEVDILTRLVASMSVSLFELSVDAEMQEELIASSAKTSERLKAIVDDVDISRHKQELLRSDRVSQQNQETLRETRQTMDEISELLDDTDDSE